MSEKKLLVSFSYNARQYFRPTINEGHICSICMYIKIIFFNLLYNYINEWNYHNYYYKVCFKCYK